jgi:hypothetical protein
LAAASLLCHSERSEEPASTHDPPCPIQSPFSWRLGGKALNPNRLGILGPPPLGTGDGYAFHHPVQEWRRRCDWPHAGAQKTKRPSLGEGWPFQAKNSYYRQRSLERTKANQNEAGHTYAPHLPKPHPPRSRRPPRRRCPLQDPKSLYLRADGSIPRFPPKASVISLPLSWSRHFPAKPGAVSRPASLPCPIPSPDPVAGDWVGNHEPQRAGLRGEAAIDSPQASRALSPFFWRQGRKPQISNSLVWRRSRNWPHRRWPQVAQVASVRR